MIMECRYCGEPVEDTETSKCLKDSQPTSSACYVVFQGMTWPGGKGLDDLQYKLRYTRDNTITTEERYLCASIIVAYQALIDMPTKERNKRIMQIRQATTEVNNLAQSTRHEK